MIGKEGQSLMGHTAFYAHWHTFLVVNGVKVGFPYQNLLGRAVMGYLPIAIQCNTVQHGATCSSAPTEAKNSPEGEKATPIAGPCMEDNKSILAPMQPYSQALGTRLVPMQAAPAVASDHVDR